MKDFNDFKTYFVKNYSKDIAAKSAEIAKTEILKSSNGKKELNMSELAIALAAGLTAASTTMLFDVLEQYHNWVNNEEQ